MRKKLTLLEKLAGWHQDTYDADKHLVLSSLREEPMTEEEIRNRCCYGVKGGKFDELLADGFIEQISDGRYTIVESKQQGRLQGSFNY